MSRLDASAVRRLAAFADGERGGKSAGVAILDTLPPDQVMQATAASIGFSETVFAAPVPGAEGEDTWRVRYFAPEQEIPFCGHATIALGAALAHARGDGRFTLQLNEGTVRVDGRAEPARGGSAVLQSPATTSEKLAPDVLAAFLGLFGLDVRALDPRIPPALMTAGARHVLLPLASRESLAAMAYELDAGRTVMRAHGLATVCLLYAESSSLLHVRNAFAAGGVYEDPATGAAAAALAGHLRLHGWPGRGELEIRQGDDMGVPCRLFVTVPDMPGDGVQVRGRVRVLD